MSERRSPRYRPARDRGFTLIEVLLVITMIGFLSATLAAVFTVIVRTTPDADERVTDARSLKGLVTWIPQDMDATPPGGFDDSHATWPCAGVAPADSYNVIAMSWVEEGDLTTQFAATYRYELKEATWVVARYSCQDGGTATRINMTSELPPWNPSSPPAWVEMCSSAIDDSGDCPSGSEVSDPLTQPVESMKVTLTLLDGTEYTIDAAAKNPDEDLADDPDAVTNYPPTAGAPTQSITMLAGESKVLDLYAMHGIGDPEGDFLTSAVDSYEPMSSGISVKSSDPLQVTITADPLLPPGPLPHPVALIVSDAYGGSVDVVIAVEIVLPPNDPPVATSSPYSLTIGAGESILLPLDLSHGVSDPNGDALTIDVLSPWPASLVDKPDVGAPLGPLEMLISIKPSAASGSIPDPIVTKVTDSRGASILVETYLTIDTATPNTRPDVTPFPDPAASMEAGDSVTLTVAASDPDGDLVWVVVDPDGSVPAGLAVTTSGLGVTVTADESADLGPRTIPLLVRDWSGATTSLVANVEIVPPPPPPPSPCALGALSVNQNPVGRAGTGEGPKALGQDVLVTLTYSGTCDGLVLKYDTGHPSGLGSGVGRVFPPGTPTTIVLRGDASGGSERWAQGDHVLTASTTSAVTPNAVSITLRVN